MEVVYLAGPYSSPDPLVRETRYHQLLKAEAILLKLGYCVISPIGMCHNLSKIYDFSPGYKYWMNRDRTLIERSDMVVVLTIPGWGESVGVTDEIQHAAKKGKRVVFMKASQLDGDLSPDNIPYLSDSE